MTIWFTADLHLGHRNIIEYAGRPFGGVEEMNRTLIARWNEVVAGGDTVWVLGDFALGPIARRCPSPASSTGTRSSSPGTTTAAGSGTAGGPRAGPPVYLDAGFADILHGTATLEIDGHDVLLCHFPYHGDSQDHDRHVDQRPPDDGRWLLHGHVHEKWHRNGRMINVGVDATGFRPISESEVGRLITQG